MKSFVITVLDTPVTTPVKSAVNNPLPCVAATSDVFPGRYFTIYTGTLARPLLLATHWVDVPFMADVVQTPRSVPKIMPPPAVPLNCAPGGANKPHNTGI